MSRKNRRTQSRVENTSSESRTNNRVTSTTEQNSGVMGRVRSAQSAVGQHMGLISAIGVGCGAVAYLAGTDRGRSVASSVASRVKQTTLDTSSQVSGFLAERGRGLSDYAIERGRDLSSYVVERGKNLLQYAGFSSGTTTNALENREQIEFDEKIHELQEHFKRPAA
jgi:hypothetical protein